MIGSIMSDERIQTAVREHFTPILLNRFENDSLVQEHDLYLYPTIIWLAPDGEVLERTLYGETVETLLLDLQDVLDELADRKSEDG